jgi:NlpC/P60 family
MKAQIVIGLALVVGIGALAGSAQAQISQQVARASVRAGGHREARAAEIIALARQFVGGKYVWGGSSPSNGGFDCSGLVQYVYGRNGIRLPRVAEDQYQVGKPVRYDELQPGDLIFLANTYKSGISHVGIYIGEGKMLHAKGRNYGIVIDSIGPFGAGHPGARRVLGSGEFSYAPPRPMQPIRGVAFQSLPTGTMRGDVRLTVGFDPYPSRTPVEYVIEVDGEEAVVSAEAGVIVRFDTTQVADGEHVVKLVRRNKASGARFITQSVTITTQNFR